MATIRSIGLHKPAALQYLIAEGILHQDSSERDYRWDTYYDADADSYHDDLVTTAHHVVWSRGGMVRRVFNFDVEQEKVIQALLTWFPVEEPVAASVACPGADASPVTDPSQTFLTQGTQPATDPDAPAHEGPRTVEKRTRALVVLLKSQAHVFFLAGATHVVHLPFEVDKAFPAARGIVLQRRLAQPDPTPDAVLPSAPPNSFATNTQSFLSQTFSSSFIKPSRRNASSLGSVRHSKGLRGGANAMLLEALAREAATPSNDHMPRLFSFTDPLSELGQVVNVVTGNERGLLTVNGSGHRRLEAIDRAEEIIYVSPQNEIHFDRSGNDKPLLLAVTLNHETNHLTIWSAAYLDPKSISASRKSHASAALNKVRRRSSYGPTAPGTGATTPTVRGHDRVRESFGGAGRSKTQPPSMQSSSQSRDRLSDQAVDDALASQLNPTLDTARQPKESRRVSSLVARAELSTSFDKTAFHDLATQRTSLGGSFNASFSASQRSRHSLGNDRTSFGVFSRRSNRGTSPQGSVTSRLSMASMDDDMMDDDTLDTLDDYDELDDLFSPPDAESGQEAVDRLRKELVMSRIADFSLQRYLKEGTLALQTAPKALSKVFTCAAPFNSATLHERRLHIYITHSSLRCPLQCELAITRKRLPSSAMQSRSSTIPPRYACMPRFIDFKEIPNTVDVIKIVEGHTERVVRLTSSQPSEQCLALTAGWGTHLPTSFSMGLLKVFNPYAVLQDDQLRVNAGFKRTLSAREPLTRLLSMSSGGSFDVLDAEFRRHRLQIQLAPLDPYVAHLFHVLSTVLSHYAGEILLEIWWNVRRSLSNALHSDKDLDWTAFVTTLMTIVVPFIDERTVKAKKHGKDIRRRNTARLSGQSSSGDGGAWRTMCIRQDVRPEMKACKSSSWSWIDTAPIMSASMSPPARRSSKHHTRPSDDRVNEQSDLLVFCAAYARDFLQSPEGKAANEQWRRQLPSQKDTRIECISEILVTLHLLREEQKLDIFSSEYSSSTVKNVAPVLAQLGQWLRWEGWSPRPGGYFVLDGGSSQQWMYEESSLKSSVQLHPQPWSAPPSILEWLSTMLRLQAYVPFPTLASLIRPSKASPHSSINLDEIVAGVTPRTLALHKFFRDFDRHGQPRKTVELIEQCGITARMLASLPETAKAPLMEAITRCQACPPTTWSSSLLQLIRREDLDLSLAPASEVMQELQHNSSNMPMGASKAIATRDVHTICSSFDRQESKDPTSDATRYAITRLIFNEDRRCEEASSLLEPLKQAVAQYHPDARLDDVAILEGQKALMQWVMIRSFSLPVGNSMFKYNSKKPLLTEKYPLYGFSTSCLMKPMGNVVTADRANYSEERYFWAFFNVGASAGLSISRDAQGIDTSWIMYNKPAELTNKHAGLLLGLGLNGHLRAIAKWLSFKYLTPKHTMTSVGLLLGLSASYMGTMDTLVTRLLSVHVTRMLPPGAAELNLSPYTQTTGLMGIGLLYYNTQHRRMSEVMLSEIEHVDEVDPSEPPDTLRDEAYRLAAGFALGFINLGQGKDLQGLHDMRILERLMSVAVAPKPVDIVHILDQATAGAVIAVALIFMKTHDKSVARKIDVPDTIPQFDYVRPDIFLLRTLAKHIIMWDQIEADHEWIKKNLPFEYRGDFNLRNISKLQSKQMPFFNILAGLLWSVSLKFAGTGNIQVRDFLIRYLDQFVRINKVPALRYDSKLARNTVRNCQDLVALSAATVMAGTGDLDVYRRLRGLHGRVSPDVPYGSHLAAHMAIGALFVAGGTHTFSTSNKAIASLICAFYPIFPQDVQDSRAHLQAFRHFWVLATEPRCLVVRDVDTGRAIHMPILIHLQDSTTKEATSPCLLPELSTISTIQTQDPAFWPTTLDFIHNPLHLHTFRKSQTLHVRRRPPGSFSSSPTTTTITTPFSTTLTTLSAAIHQNPAHNLWHWLLTLPALSHLSAPDLGLVVPLDGNSSTVLEPADTVVDTRLVLRRLGASWRRDELWVLRGVLEWAEAVRREGKVAWVGEGVLEGLRMAILERGRTMG